MQYRNLLKNTELKSFHLKLNESDILVFSNKNVKKKAFTYLKEARSIIVEYIKKNPSFEKSFRPLDIDKNAPSIIQSMLQATRLADVGPMASVAGAVAEYVGKHLAKETDEIIVENGGDIYLKSNKPRHVLIYAGRSKLSEKLAIKLPISNKPYGICTSSGTVGHSFSFGKADAVVIVSHSPTLSDAWATKVANKIINEAHIKDGINLILNQSDLLGGVIIIKDKLAIGGDLNLEKV